MKAQIRLMSFFLLISPMVFSQTTTPDIQKGKVISSFMIDYTGAERDIGNFEFEVSFRNLNSQIQATYLLTDQLGIGIGVGTMSLNRTFIDTNNQYPGQTYFSENLRSYRIGVYPTYFIKLNQNNRDIWAFLESGIFTYATTFEREGFGEIDEQNPGYRLAAGLLYPIGNRIMLSTKLQRDSYREEMTGFIFNEGNRTVIEETKWPAITSLSFGLTVSF